MNQEILDAVNLIARIFTFDIRAQAPSRKIANSIQVKPIITDTEIDWEVDYGDVIYGLFLDFGTKSERAEERGSWTPFPGKGTGGIKPRFFTTPSEAVILQAEEILSQAYSKIQEQTLENELKDI